MATVTSARSLFFTWTENFRADFYPDVTCGVRDPAKNPTAFARKQHSRSAGSITVSTDGCDVVKVKETKKRSKSVHFADSKGLSLVTLITFNVERELQEEFSRYLNLSQKQCVTSDDDDVFTPTQDASKSKRATIVRNDAQLSAKTIAERLKLQKVCLEKTEVVDSAVKGVICVYNLAYHKSVEVRYTFDDWKTQAQVEGVFHENDGAVDRFTFEIPLPADDDNACAKMKNLKVEFAISYKVLDKTYWDNNNGFNHRVLLAQT